MTTPTHLSLEAHFRFSTQIAATAKRTLEAAEETGDTRMVLEALKTAIAVQEFAGKELSKYKIRKQVIEAASCLNGDFDNKENVELGSWSDGHENDITARAQEIIETYKGLSW